ncbi:MAG: type II secretion system protein [Candidatus Cloacimonadota bacterium]|nr:type II secretion system protein [Candidatus Cloacimonadota bacterium]
MAEKKQRKFSLIDLLMIIMIVGIIFTFYGPLKQIKLSQKRVHAILNDLEFIAQKDVQFSRTEAGDGDYAFDISQLNLKDGVLEEEFFTFGVSDTTVYAISKDTFGEAGAELHYYLPNGPFSVKEDELSRKVIEPNWLP